LLEVPLPVIAAVNGHAYGGGLETAMACDFIYAARNARFALSELRLGIMPGGGGTQNLPRAVGERRAKELILRAQAFDAEQGLRWGLVNHVSEPGRALDDALGAAADITRNGPLAVRQAKKSIHYGLQGDLHTGCRFEIEAYNRLVSSEDRHEGVRAFNEKRTPQFKGR
jgi:enoyl-CoA hydratase/carnithine racemase